MTWMKDTALALLSWGWAKLRAAGEIVVDPPPARLKMLFWIVLAGVVGYWALVKPATSWVGDWVMGQVFGTEPVPGPVYLIPRTVITTVPPAVSEPVKKPVADTLAEAPKTPETAVKKRRVKAAKKPATEAYWPF